MACGASAAGACLQHQVSEIEQHRHFVDERLVPRLAALATELVRQVVGPIG